MKPRLYFAYGSNMDPRQMRVRCPQARRVGRGSLRGYRFLINRRGVATLQRDGRTRVMGVLWELGSDCEESLDRHEGVVWGFYRKERVWVMDEENNPVSALTYIDPIAERGLPRPGYFERVILGAKRARIPMKNFAAYLQWATGHAA